MSQRLVFTLLAVCAVLSCVFYLRHYMCDRIDISQQTDRISAKIRGRKFEDEQCDLAPEIIEEIACYQPIVNQIINASLNGIFKGRTWRTLARFVDKFGSRLAGSANLENAIDYMVDVLKRNHLENVHTEPVIVPHWTRGEEYAWMVSPRLEKLAMVGLGLSVGTPGEGITAQILVIKSFEELKKKSALVQP